MLSNSGPDRSAESLVAEVDSLDVPDRIGTSDTLTVGLYGTVGPNGCYSLNRLDVERAEQRGEIVPVVQQVRAENVMCTAAIVELDTSLTLAPPFAAGTVTGAVPPSAGGDGTATGGVGGEPS